MTNQEITQLNEFKLKAILIEYQALKNELLQKFNHELQTYSITITAIAIMLGFVVEGKNYDILLVIPVISSAFAFNFIWERNIIYIIAGYLKKIEDEILPEIIGFRNTYPNCPKYWVGWEHHFSEHSPKHSYKIAVEALFVAIPIFPALIYSMIVVKQYFVPTSIQINSFIPMPVHVCMILIYLFLACYLYWKLLKT